MSRQLTKLTTQFDYNGRCYYIRTSSKESKTLSNLLALRYSSKKDKECLLANSGIHAISSVFQSICIGRNWSNDINIVYGNELYCDTPRFINHLKKLYTPFNTFPIDVTNNSMILQLFGQKLKNKHNVLFIESCSNPTGQIFDFKLIGQLRRLSRSLLVIVDNTWLTDVIFNPFDYGADVVVLSLSKHYSGGNCIAGAIIADKKIKLVSILKMKFKNEGIHVNPIYCHIILQNIGLMEKRIRTTSIITQKVADYLQKNSHVHSVKYPGLTNHVSHSLTQTYFKNNLYPNVISLQLRMSKKKAISLMKSSKISYETSFGGEHSKFDCWPFYKDGLTHCRLSIGYNEDFGNIIGHLENVLR